MSNYPKRACLSGKELIDLVEGKMVSSNGIEFTYDGTDAHRLLEATESFVRKNEGRRDSARTGR